MSTTRVIRLIAIVALTVTGLSLTVPGAASASSVVLSCATGYLGPELALTFHGCTGVAVPITGHVGRVAFAPQPGEIHITWLANVKSFISTTSVNDSNNCPARSGLTRVSKTTTTGKVAKGALLGDRYRSVECHYRTTSRVTAVYSFSPMTFTA